MNYIITRGVAMAYERVTVSKHPNKREALKEARRLRKEGHMLSLQVETAPEVVWRAWKDK